MVSLPVMAFWLAVTFAGGFVLACLLSAAARADAALDDALGDEETRLDTLQGMTRLDERQACAELVCWRCAEAAGKVTEMGLHPYPCQGAYLNEGGHWVHRQYTLTGLRVPVPCLAERLWRRCEDESQEEEPHLLNGGWAA